MSSVNNQFNQNDLIQHTPNKLLKNLINEKKSLNPSDSESQKVYESQRDYLFDTLKDYHFFKLIYHCPELFEKTTQKTFTNHFIAFTSQICDQAKKIHQLKQMLEGTTYPNNQENRNQLSRGLVQAEKIQKHALNILTWGRNKESPFHEQMEQRKIAFAVTLLTVDKVNVKIPIITWAAGFKSFETFSQLMNIPISKKLIDICTTMIIKKQTQVPDLTNDEFIRLFDETKSLYPQLHQHLINAHLFQKKKLIEIFSIALARRHKDLIKLCTPYQDPRWGAILKPVDYSDSKGQLTLTIDHVNTDREKDILTYYKHVDEICFKNQEALDYVIKEQIVFPNATTCKFSSPLKFDQILSKMLPNVKTFHMSPGVQLPKDFQWEKIETLYVDKLDSQIISHFPNCKLCILTDIKTAYFTFSKSIFKGKDIVVLRSENMVAYMLANNPCVLNLSPNPLIPPLVTDEIAIEILKYYGRMYKNGNNAKVDLNNCNQLTDKTLEFIEKHFTKLIALDLSGCTKLSNEAILSMMEKLPNLRMLNLSDIRISQDTFNQCTQLTTRTSTNTNNHPLPNRDQLPRITLQLPNRDPVVIPPPTTTPQPDFCPNILPPPTAAPRYRDPEILKPTSTPQPKRLPADDAKDPNNSSNTKRPKQD